MRNDKRVILSVALAAIFLTSCGPSKDSLKSAGQVLAGHWDGVALPVDPLNAAWESTPVYTSPMKMQDIVEPKLSSPGVASVDVRAVYDEKQLVVRLNWADATVDTVAYAAKFADAVAVEFPTTPGGDVPDANMGQDGGVVQIYQWKAFWQTKAAGTMDITKSLFPNSYIDYYPAEAAKDSNTRMKMEKEFAPAWNAGNPVAHRANAAQAYVAEGFGTLTALREDVVSGSGVWKNGQWYVTLTIKLPEAGASSALVPGQRTFVALAVWDGSSGNVGARKMRTTWVPFMMAATTK